MYVRSSLIRSLLQSVLPIGLSLGCHNARVSSTSSVCDGSSVVSSVEKLVQHERKERKKKDMEVYNDLKNKLKEIDRLEGIVNLMSWCVSISSGYC
jgi:fructose-1,6-bisphosphatase